MTLRIYKILGTSRKTWSNRGSMKTGWWQLKYFVFSPRIWGRFPHLTIIFFRWVGSTTNQKKSSVQALCHWIPSSGCSKVGFLAPRVWMCSDGETGGFLVFLCFLFSGGGYLLTGLFLKSFFTYLSRNILIKNEYDMWYVCFGHGFIPLQGAYVSGIAQSRKKHMGGIKTKPVQ